MFDALIEHLGKQGTSEVEILYDESSALVGVKRQSLLQAAKGEYVVSIDDDDWVSDDYIPSILEAIEHKPDCIGMKGWMTTNGGNKQEWVITKDEPQWVQRGNTFYRHTSHLTPVKRSIALSVGFKPISHGEDYKYSMGLVGLLTTEVFIDKELYFYRFISNK